MPTAKQTKLPERNQILIVDDEPGIRRILEAVFAKDGYKVYSAENGRKALEILENTPISIVITDLIMPDMNGIELLKAARQKRPEIIVVVMTAYGAIKTAVDAIRYGAADYITKPFDVNEMRTVVARAVAKSASPNSQPAKSKTFACSSVGSKKIAIFGKSSAMAKVWDTVRRAAKSKATVLIRGESGVGKELIARALHEYSGRASEPFIAVASAALPEALLESELFGHEKNAFTGAAAQRIGRFELADKGTLFLDEIGDISPVVQVKLLRVLQERCFERIGGEKTINVDVRVIAATNSDLEALIDENKFRKDLYYRLQVIQIVAPPLRERKEDIEALASEFVRRFSIENERAPLAISPETLAVLESYPWPGNVCELENVMERCVVMTDEEETTLRPEHLPASVRENA